MLGAGFTKAIFPSAPLNRDLLGKIENLKKYQEKYHEQSDIEILLTHLDLEAIKDEEKRADRATITNEIAGYFSNFRFSRLNGVLPPWIKVFASDILKRNDAIINLNYDCSLEGILDNYGVWSPNNGYARIGHGFEEHFPKNQKDIKIYKIHGSENFREGGTANASGRHPNQTVVEFTGDASIYPRSKNPVHPGGNIFEIGPYIIAPSFVKIPHVDIAAMMIDALDMVRTVKNFVIIGCSMRLEDSFLWLLLTAFLNRSQQKQLVIIDPLLAEEIRNRILNYWVGDIKNNHTNIHLISKKIEDGIDSLASALK